MATRFEIIPMSDSDAAGFRFSVDIGTLEDLGFSVRMTSLDDLGITVTD